MRQTTLFLVLLSAVAGCDDGTDPGTDAGDVDGGEGDDGGGVDSGGNDGGMPGFTLPVVGDACGALDVGAPETVVATGVPDVVAAVAPDEVGIVFVDIDGGDSAAFLQRTRHDGTLIGTPVMLFGGLGDGPGAAAIATDGTRYVICAHGPNPLQCGTVPVGGGAFTPGTTMAGMRRPSLAYGAGGFFLVFQSMTGRAVQAIDENGVLAGTAREFATGTGRPGIAPTDDGYVIGWVDGAARAQRLDAAGADMGAPLSFGAARADTPVAVTFTEGAVGAVFLAVDGDAVAAVEGSTPVIVGPGAAGYGRVAVARAANGIVAAWSDFNGFIGVAVLGLDGAVMGSVVQAPSSWDDNAHALAATPDGFLLATSTTPAGTPIHVHSLTCP